MEITVVIFIPPFFFDIETQTETKLLQLLSTFYWDLYFNWDKRVKNLFGTYLPSWLQGFLNILEINVESKENKNASILSPLLLIFNI